MVVQRLVMERPNGFRGFPRADRTQHYGTRWTCLLHMFSLLGTMKRLVELHKGQGPASQNIYIRTLQFFRVKFDLPSKLVIEFERPLEF